MNPNGAVCAIVVTYNRKELLRECLGALAAQTRPLERVLVVDNASTDGTQEMVEAEFPDVDLLALPTNQGGAGGFHEGLKDAHAGGAEWIWLMDDDTIAEPDALAELLGAPARLDPGSPPTLLASKVVWKDGTIHPMNAPWPERSRMDRVIDGAERGLVPLRFATFVSLLVHRGVVDRHGLPYKHFFIWSDDVEYTSRSVLGGDRAYLVPTSLVVHKTPTAHFFMSAPPERFYYHVRNTMFMLRGPGRPARDRLVRGWVLATTVPHYLATQRSVAATKAVFRALYDGVRTPPVS